MRPMVIDILTQLLNNNQGNRITPELATGILTTMNHLLLQAEQAPAATLAPGVAPADNGEGAYPHG